MGNMMMMMMMQMPEVAAKLAWCFKRCSSPNLWVIWLHFKWLKQLLPLLEHMYVCCRACWWSESGPFCGSFVLLCAVFG
jgi:hypothetical protein